MVERYGDRPRNDIDKVHDTSTVVKLLDYINIDQTKALEILEHHRHNSEVCDRIFSIHTPASLNLEHLRGNKRYTLMEYFLNKDDYNNALLFVP